MKKFKQVLHYAISRSCHAPNVGKTVLYKILYFAEFDFYELYERKLTGERYFRLEHGPAPSHFDAILTELETEGKITQFMAKYHGYDQKRYVSNEEPDISLLSAEELQHIENTLAKYSNMTAAQVSALSHIDLPWMATEPNGEIDYELVFYRDPQTSVREYEQPVSP
ncbi:MULTISPECIES: Panacea domain-containing protein [unclassified Methanoculleus]|jgi:uncharacterized phage-associated protein|uniref:Panacea domain-containing protein n=1 Tax=Methanoculleus palmolei TaxID=72612 RepID=A0ABD8ABA1_9EURY|nr:Panacea domain-containing protein [Methanoculleus sp. UBA377]MDD2473939.1 Panacea domain-containing protein [Methanoculleus sp.]WOX56415.1 Panacea domain-containing protein [Methanoculleus palmolei]